MVDNKNVDVSADENQYLSIVKFILVIACVCGIVLRTKIDDIYVNGYMAVVNIVSFLIAFNLFMYDCYFKLRARSRESNDNIFRKSRIETLVMILYVLIFIFNGLILWMMYDCYIVKKYDMSVLNDCLGIMSLGFALTTDFLSRFVLGIMSLWE